ncbi:MAG TPA: response regulator [Planctomycetota bacterium]|nr:response regulator [Planctomycetota bacterium]
MTPAAILVIDDDSLVRWSLAQHLTRRGYRVAAAGSAAEALALVRAVPRPQVVVLDLKLPDMDGLALLEVLRREAAPCPIIVLSAHLTPEVTVEALAKGATFVAEKPFQLDTLCALVQRALEGTAPQPR